MRALFESVNARRQFVHDGTQAFSKQINCKKKNVLHAKCWGAVANETRVVGWQGMCPPCRLNRVKVMIAIRNSYAFAHHSWVIGPSYELPSIRTNAQLSAAQSAWKTGHLKLHPKCISIFSSGDDHAVDENGDTNDRRQRRNHFDVGQQREFLHSKGPQAVLPTAFRMKIRSHVRRIRNWKSCLYINAPQTTCRALFSLSTP